MITRVTALESYLVTTTDASGRPIYKHQEREQFLFYLQSRSKGLWMASTESATLEVTSAEREIEHNNVSTEGTT